MDEKKREKKQTAGADDDGHKRNWREVYASVEDIQLYLSDHIYLRHNVITGRVEFRVPEPDLFESQGATGLQLPVSDEWQPVSDRIVNSLWAAMSMEKTVRWALQIIASIISAVLTALGTTSCMGL